MFVEIVFNSKNMTGEKSAKLNIIIVEDSFIANL